jgi:hypothetical protein
MKHSLKLASKLTTTLSRLAIITYALITTTNSHAATAFSNLAPGGGATASDKNYSNISRWAQEFTSTNDGEIAEIKLNIYRTNSQSADLDVQIWSDNGGDNPNTLLANLYTLNWSNAPLNNTATNNSDTVDISTFDNNHSLISGTTYWLVLSQSSNGPQAKRWTITGSDNGTIASYNHNQSKWTNHGSSANLGAEISIIPEPAKLSLITAALIGFAAISRRRRI